MHLRYHQLLGALSAALGGSSFIHFNPVEPTVRVRAGDYVWMEAIVEEKTIDGDGNGDGNDADGDDGNTADVAESQLGSVKLFIKLSGTSDTRFDDLQRFRPTIYHRATLYV